MMMILVYHNLCCGWMKDHSINPINCDFVRAVKRIHQIVNNDELIQEQERFWDSRQGLDFLVS